MIKNNLLQMVTGVKIVFAKDQGYFAWFLVLTVLFFSGYILMPVWLIPGNSIELQLDVFKMFDYILLVALSLVMALFIIMQAFLFIDAKKAKQKVKLAGRCGVGTSSALFGGLLATASCASCIAPLLGFFGIGLGGIILILQYRFYIFAGVVVLLFISIYFTARKIQKTRTIY